MSATIRDVAKEAGTSISTVSRVLNATTPVNEQVAKKVLAAVDRLNYSPDAAAQSMRTRKTKLIGVMIPDYSNIFYAQLLKHIHDQTKKAGYQEVVLSIGDDAENEGEEIDRLIKRNIDGLIVCSYKGDKATVEHLIKLSNKLPLVFMDNMKTPHPVNAVYTHSRQAIEALVNHLCENGHKRIGFVKATKRYNVRFQNHEQ